MFDANSKGPAYQSDSVTRMALPALGAGTSMLYDSVDHRLQLALPTPGLGNSFTYDSSSRSVQLVQPTPGGLLSIAYDSGAAVLRVPVGQRTTYTSHNAIGQRANVLPGGRTTFGFDNSTQCRVLVPTDRSTTFTHDNLTSLRSHVEALPTPWLGGTAVEPCVAAAPGPFEIKPLEGPKGFDYAAAKKEQNRRENADLLAKIRAAIEDGSLDELCLILTQHPVVGKMRCKAFRRAGIEINSEDPVTQDARQNGDLLFLQFLRGKGSPAWFAKNWYKLLPALANVVGNECLAAARMARAAHPDVTLMCDYSPDQPDVEFRVADVTNADLKMDLADELTHMPQSWSTAFEEQRAGDSLAAIAAREGCSESTIQRRVDHARAWLQVKLGVYDGPGSRR